MSLHGYLFFLSAYDYNGVNFLAGECGITLSRAFLSWRENISCFLPKKHLAYIIFDYITHMHRDCTGVNK